MVKSLFLESLQVATSMVLVASCVYKRTEFCNIQLSIYFDSFNLDGSLRKPACDIVSATKRLTFDK